MADNFREVYLTRDVRYAAPGSLQHLTQTQAHEAERNFGKPASGALATGGSAIALSCGVRSHIGSDLSLIGSFVPLRRHNKDLSLVLVIY